MCTVDTPAVTYVKAIAQLDDHTLVVMDRREQVLITFDLPSVAVSDTQWRYGEDVLVTNTPGCSCGGLRVINKEVTP